MGMLVREWVIEKLGVPVPDSSDFLKGLSNGFIIAEILRKYSIISDDQMIALRHNFEESTKIKNMTNVHRWMTGAGIGCFDLLDLLDVAEEKPGAIIKFLYQLYFVLEGGGGRGSLQPLSETALVASSFLPDFDYGIEKDASVSEVQSRLSQVNNESATTIIEGGLDQELQVLSVTSSSPWFVEGDEKIDLELAAPIVSPSLSTQNVVTSDKEMSQLYFRKSQIDNESKTQDASKMTMENLQKIDFSGIEEAERIRLMKMRAKLEREAKLVREMYEFDAMLDEAAEAEESSTTTKQQFSAIDYYNGESLPTQNKVKVHPRNVEPILPNPVGMQLRLNKLKCERKEEQVASEERVKYRRTACAQMLKQIPLMIHNDLVETALAKTQIICDKEIELAQFLIGAYRPKEIFLDHLRLEENELHLLRCARSDLLAQERDRKKSLERMTNDLIQQRSQRVEDERSGKEMALLLKIIHHQLNMMVRLATRIGDYRQMMNEDPSPEQIAEWKAWLLLGLETPPEPDRDESSSDSEDFQFNLKDGNCRIVLSETPIPAELGPPKPSLTIPTPSQTSQMSQSSSRATNVTGRPLQSQIMENKSQQGQK